MILAGSFLIFFLLPRVSSRYLMAYSPTNDVSTGFTDRVQLGRIGQIQQSSETVMHIAIDNDLHGRLRLEVAWRCAQRFRRHCLVESFWADPVASRVGWNLPACASWWIRAAHQQPRRPPAESFVIAS